MNGHSNHTAGNDRNSHTDANSVQNAQQQQGNTQVDYSMLGLHRHVNTPKQTTTAEILLTTKSQ